MPRLGEYPVISGLLGQIDLECREKLRAYARFRFVPAGAADDVVQEAFHKLICYVPRDEIAARLSCWGGTDDDVSVVKNGLKALLFKNLCLYAIPGYHRSQRRWDNTLVIAAETADPVDDAMGMLVSRLFPDGEVTVESVTAAETRAIERLCERLFERARLLPEERRFLEFRITNPSAADYEAFPTYARSTVSKIKSRAIGKIQALLNELCHVYEMKARQ